MKVSSTLIGIVVLLLVTPLALAGPFPTWENQINTPGRFRVLNDFLGEAVFDRETGLVWELQSANTLTNWYQANTDCGAKVVGNRKGWRLPTLQELASLVDPTRSSPALPGGHPFTNVLLLDYWSATSHSDPISGDLLAWVVEFKDGDVLAPVSKLGNSHVWCVRGGQGVDPQ